MKKFAFLMIALMALSFSARVSLAETRISGDEAPAKPIPSIPAGAKSLFSDYVRWTGSFDEKLLGLYADDADIQGWHTDGQTGKMVKTNYTTAQQREIYAQFVPQMKALKATVQFSQETYKLEGQGVRIQADLEMAFPERGRIPGQVSLLIAPDENGKWLIKQEISHSHQP